MFTDMVGYSALAQADEAVALEVLARHNRLLRPIFTRFHGREIKTVGDAFLIEFDSALEATECAIEIQKVLHDYNLSSADKWRVRIRIGLHVGDVVQTSNDVLGDAVNVASRIEPLADPGGICLTQQVYDQVQNKLSLSLLKLAPTALKNIRTPVSVYRIVQPWDVGAPSLPVPGVAKGRQLAVLPLVNISPDPRDEYFADGLTEELISVLSQVRGLSVIARTSVATYKSAPKSISQVGQELGVDSIIEGSVRKSGNRIRITLQLIDVATQGHIWANSYNREMDDVFAVQSDIAERTAEALRLELAKSGDGGSHRTHTPVSGAYDQYLQGLVAANEREHTGLDRAVHFFEEAIRLDPTFAEPYASWAQALVRAAGDALPMREAIPRARELAAKALELDPYSSGAHSSLANILLQFDHDWTGSEAEFVKAIELNPSNVDAYQFYALLLMAQERFEKAKEEIRHAIQLNPSGHYSAVLAWADLETGQYDASFDYGRGELQKHPNSGGPRTFLGIGYLQAGHPELALKEAEVPMANPTDDERFDRALLDAMVGRPEVAKVIIAEVEGGHARSYTSATHLAMLYGAIGQPSKAIELLEKDYREGDPVLWLYYRSVFFDDLRTDPRFVTLLREYGLPTRPIIRPGPTRL